MAKFVLYYTVRYCKSPKAGILTNLKNVSINNCEKLGAPTEYWISKPKVVSLNLIRTHPF